MTEFKVTIKGNKLTIEGTIPKDPQLSKSGKMVESMERGGFMQAGIERNGQPGKVNVVGGVNH